MFHACTGGKQPQQRACLSFSDTIVADPLPQVSRRRGAGAILTGVLAAACCLVLLGVERPPHAGMGVQLISGGSTHPTYRELMRQMDAVAADDRQQKMKLKGRRGENAALPLLADAGGDESLSGEQNVFDDWDHAFLSREPSWENRGGAAQHNIYDELPSLADVGEDPKVVQGVLEKWGITSHLAGFSAAWAAVDGSKPMEKHFKDTGYTGR